ncbi:DNA damage-regulated autophagy modulator protein 1-like [Varroa jacobsoni]|uniref:CWH43-like N-terminal domain-containing protein n=1 Tax=Varroa destructor TaxID=109461 RepID=A0A7M7KK69_VARDE|nr:DNA damage-regulated autophagy modulator protein 1-like isoform X2 [Varroa destructor]XP_022707952.1 DNA damage-regulated autophagy modulator protein 1-like [Varroa jacobsoni]
MRERSGWIIIYSDSLTVRRNSACAFAPSLQDLEMPPWSPVTFFNLISPDLFPYLAGATFFATCFTSLPIAFAYGHVSGFPYISDIGTFPPEANIFGLMLSICAILTGITIWNVYATIRMPTATNGYACLVGLLAAFGVQVVANFQETVIFKVHITGAMMAFGLATVYLWLTLFTSLHLRKFRAGCSVIATISLFLTSTSGIISFYYFKGTKMTHWRPEDGGYSWHVVSVFSEWILALTVNAFIVTLAKDIGKDDEQISLLNGRNDRETGQTDIQPDVLRERSVR